MGERVRGSEWETEGKDRGWHNKIFFFNKARGPAVSYSKRLCGFAIFFFLLSHSFLCGNFLFLSLSVPICSSCFFSSFYNVLFFIFLCLLVSSGAVSFLLCQVC